MKDAFLRALGLGLFITFDYIVGDYFIYGKDSLNFFNYLSLGVVGTLILTLIFYYGKQK